MDTCVQTVMIEEQQAGESAPRFTFSSDHVQMFKDPTAITRRNVRQFFDSLRVRPDENQPTDFARSIFHELVRLFLDKHKVNMPDPMVFPSFDSGIDVVWARNNRELKVHIAGSLSKTSYIYKLNDVLDLDSAIVEQVDFIKPTQIIDAIESTW